MSLKWNPAPYDDASSDAATRTPSPPVRPLQDCDIAQVVAIHSQAIPYSLTSLLGKSHLADMYHALLLSDHAFCLVAVDSSDRILGVIAGATDFKKALRSVLTVNLLLRLPFRLLSSPIAVTELLCVALRQSAHHPPGVPATLLSIAVDAATRGQGVGKKLVESLEEAFKARGVRDYWLETTKANLNARNFYAALGFVEFSRGRRDICFHKRIAL